MLDLKTNALDQAIQSHNAAEELHARLDVGQLELDFSHPAIASEIFGRCVELAKRVGDKPAELKAVYGLAVAFFSMKSYTEALAHYGQAITIADAETDHSTVLRSRLGVGKSNIALGNFDQGLHEILSGAV